MSNVSQIITDKLHLLKFNALFPFRWILQPINVVTSYNRVEMPVIVSDGETGKEGNARNVPLSVSTPSSPIELTSEISSELEACDNIEEDDTAALAFESEDTHGTSLLSSSNSESLRNYEIYNRMEGCSSDEETQTDHDYDDEENGAEELPEHMYAALNDSTFEFGEFMTANIEDIPNNDDEKEWQEAVTGVSLDQILSDVPNASSENSGIFSFSPNFEDDSLSSGNIPGNFGNAPVDQRELSAGETQHLPTASYVSIPPLSAGTA